MNARLKLFTYALEDCHLEAGFQHHPVPVLSQPDPARFEPVTSPAEADFIVLPVRLNDVGSSHVAEADYLYSYLPRLAHFREFEAKHVFYLAGVDTWAPLFTSAVVFRASLHRKFPDLNAVPIPYYGAQMPEALGCGEIIYHTVFEGFTGSWRGREELVRALSQTKEIHCSWRCTPQFHYHLTPEQQAENARAYRASFLHALTVCCPRGAGLNSFRFFETLAAGRIPVLISDDCILPCEDVLDYSRFSLRLPEARIPEIGNFLANWISQTPPMQIAEMCAAARQAWESHFCVAKQTDLVLHSLRRIKATGYQLNAAQAPAVEALRRASGAAQAARQWPAAAPTA